MPKRSAQPVPADSALPIEPVAEPAPTSDAAPAVFAEVPVGKYPAAVALGRLGGKKGGPARAAKLSKKRLSEIGKKAAATRWGKKSR